MIPPEIPESPSRRALLVGLSHVDATAYGSAMREGCEGCLHDVAVMKNILSPLGYLVTTLTDQNATVARLENDLKNIAVQSRPGDVFLFYYTGHGDQLPDQEPGHPLRDEPDGFDECYCLYDQKWRDDFLYQIWLKFPPGALIYCITDSCRSGTAVRNAHRRLHIASHRTTDFITHQDAFPCPLLHIAASRDTTMAQGGEDGSLLTTNIQRIWNTSRFLGTWEDFLAKLAADMPTQPLQGNLYGPNSQNVRYLTPFSPL